jgi:precorrin-3B methylase
MNGKIYLVGFGPGAEEHMSFKAKAAIAESDVVIGYTTYIKLVKDLLDKAVLPGTISTLISFSGDQPACNKTS